MNIHEHQAKALLKSFGAPVADGVAVFSAEEARKAADQLPGPLWVVKSQIHAGGRGKGKFKELPADAKGGVRLAFTKEDVERHAREMLGNTLVTHQTGPAGRQVNRLYIEDGADIARELYLSLLVNRDTGRVAYVVSTEGGMDIEEVAEHTPDKIITLNIDPETGVTDADAGGDFRCAEPRRRGAHRYGGAGPDPLPGLHRKRHEHAGDKPAHRHGERPSARSGRQGQL